MTIAFTEKGATMTHEKDNTADSDLVGKARQELPGWEREIAFAQLLKDYVYVTAEGPVCANRFIYEGIGLPRSGHCGDCQTPTGLLHVPGCEVERCPNCNNQVISCSCERVVTWHKLLSPDKNVKMGPETVNPVVSYAHGLCQLERFHILLDDNCYWAIMEDPGQSRRPKNYVLTFAITPEILRALRALPQLED
jgi:hypothetical protein